MKTITIRIKNYHPKISQENWSTLYTEVDEFVRIRRHNLHYFGQSLGNVSHPWFMWVFEYDKDYEWFKNVFSKICKEHGIEKVLLTVGETYEITALDYSQYNIT